MTEPTFRQKLLYRFRKQEEFTADYSPLYTHLFGTIANCLEADDNPVATWLVTASEQRNAFDIPLLLAAALHRDVLLAVPETADLAAYYPSVAGERPSTDPQFATALHDTIMARRSELAAFIQSATVQTNETGRGLCWLLPLLYTHWPAVHLVDLGASAGLNLIADQRAYRLIDETNQHALADIGAGQPPQFLVRCTGQLPNFPMTQLPKIRSRLGGDIQPFALETAVAESTLAAFIWPDQLERQQRLREGIAALHTINRSDAPIQLNSLTLPDELPYFLTRYVPDDDTPVVLYNTYITQYLPEKGVRLRQYITDWAAAQTRPILWLQWEPDRDNQAAPEYGWLRWTADLWHNQTQQQFHLAWVHPHGTNVQFEPGLDQWAAHFS